LTGCKPVSFSRSTVLCGVSKLASKEGSINSARIVHGLQAEEGQEMVYCGCCICWCCGFCSPGSEQAGAVVEVGAVKASICQSYCYVASLVRFMLKGKRNKKKCFTFSWLAFERGDLYKVSKIDHYDVVKSFEGCYSARTWSHLLTEIVCKSAPTLALNSV
jgi:hypothetical protein